MAHKLRNGPYSLKCLRKLSKNSLWHRQLFKVQMPWSVPFFGTQMCSFIYISSTAAFVLQWQCWAVAKYGMAHKSWNIYCLHFNRKSWPTPALTSCSSKCDPWTSSVAVIGELVGKAESCPSSQIYRISSGPLGNSRARGSEDAQVYYVRITLTCSTESCLFCRLCTSLT